MRWASALGERAEHAQAIGDALAALSEAFSGVTPTFVLVSFSPHHRPHAGAIMARVVAAFPEAAVVGSCALGVLADGREREDEPAIALVAAHLPGAKVHAFRLGENDADLAAIADAVSGENEGLRCLVLVGDPWTCDADVLLPALDEAFPGVVKVGGLVSGGSRRGATTLAVGETLYTDGLVGLAMSGDVVVDTLVAQACRPVGEPMIITRSRGHIIDELGRRPPADMLRELFEVSSERDKELLRTALFVAVERKKSVRYAAGDTLVRDVVGLDPRTGSLAIATQVSDWDVLQFVVRDADTARENWTRQLAKYTKEHEGQAAHGAMHFSCIGRGKGLFGEESYESRVLRDALGPLPAGGFFCHGEIGPIGASTFLHGHTSVLALFRPGR